MHSPGILISAKLPSLRANLTPDVFNNLASIGQVLKSHRGEEKLIKLKKERDDIILNSIYHNDVLVRGLRGYKAYW